MPTIKQKRLAKVIIENSTVDKPLNAGAMLEKVGYAKSVAEAKSKDILESDGVQKALEQSGFTEDNAKSVVQSILNNAKTEPNARLKAADMVFKVHGSYAPDKSINVNITQKAIDPTDPDIIKNMQAIQEKLENE